MIASAGRASVLLDAMVNVDRLDGEFLKIVSVPDEASLPADVPPGWRVLVGVRGSAAQRNVALDSLTDEEHVFFFDDDSVIRGDYVAEGVRFFDANPAVVGLTGRVLADGAVSGEIPLADAEAAVDGSASIAPTGRWEPTRELYGCNFAYRRSADPDIRFDGRLPLYSWLEDHDLARRLMRIGTLAEVDDCVIVHRAASSGGRQSHLRLGYSQVMNPVYLFKKGSFPFWLAANELLRRVAKNVAYSLIGPEREWRRKRLRGNAIAARDAIAGRITPERITEL